MDDCLAGVDGLGRRPRRAGRGPGVTAYLLERAWVDGAVHDDVYVEIEDGRFVSVELGVAFPELVRRFLAPPSVRIPGRPGNPARLPGLTIPGLANCHSHAFHRALQGADAAGTRDVLDVAGADVRGGRAARPRLVPRAGHGDVPRDGRVGHHGRGGVPLPAPPGRRDAVRRPQRHGPRPAAGGPRRRPADPAPRHGVPQQRLRRASEGVQERFSDGTADAWAERVRDLEDAGAAIHSVRAVPDDQLRTIVEAAAGKPLHVHLSEQTAENDACVAAYGATPTQLLADHGVLGPLTSAVHATHLTDDDIGHLGATRTFACFCPTTERDLGDGIGPSRRLHDAGSPLTLGSDSHAVIDLFEEMRAVELDERLATRERGHWSAGELLRAATIDGHASLGYDDAGAIAVGAPRRPGHPRHHHAPHRRHRPRRAHRRLRGHRRRRRPGRRRRQGRLHPGRRARHRPRPRRHDREALAVTHRHHQHRRAGHQRPAGRRPPRHRHRRCRRPRGRPGRVDRARRRRPGGRRPRRRRWPRRHPRLRGLPLPPGLRGRPRAGVRRPDGRDAVRRRRHPHHRRRHPGGDRRAADRPRGRTWSPRCGGRARPRSRSRAATG